MYSSIIFKIKALDTQSQTKKYNTVYWVNFRLFEHTKALKTGKDNRKELYNI